MPSINLNDALKLDLNAKTADDPQLDKLLAPLGELKNTHLNEVPADQAQRTLTFGQPLSFAGTRLSIKAGERSEGTLTVIGPKGRVLDKDDPFTSVSVSEDEIYLALKLTMGADASVGTSVETFSFGLSAEKVLEVTCYRRFRNTGAGFPTVVEAFRSAVGSFRLPQSASDLASLDEDTILVIGGTGTLAVSGGFTVQTQVETLAPTDLPAGQPLEFNAGGSFDIELGLKLTGGFQVRLRRSGPDAAELGIYTDKSRELELEAPARIGVSAQAGNFDLAEKFVGALSRQPTVEVQEFKKVLGGEDAEAREKQITSFQSSLDNAVSTQVQLSVKGALSAARSNESVWMFEIDRNAVNSEPVAKAVASAFKGDFVQLTRGAGQIPPGIRQTQNILTRTDVCKQTLKVNLFGLVNGLSSAKIARISTVELNKNGEITLITDTANASRLQAVLLNAGLDTKRLRRLLSQEFLLEAAYHLTGVYVLPPDFRSRQAYLEIHEKTDLNTMKDNLDVIRALGLITPDEVSRMLAGRKDFGRTSLYVEIRYSDDAINRLFFIDGKNPKKISDYEQIGRISLALLLSGDSGQEFRKQIADVRNGDNLWNQLKEIGAVAQFGPAFGLPANTTDPRVAAVGADYIAITSWAAAMSQAAIAVHEVLELTGQGQFEENDPKLKKAREELKRRMESVVKNTHDQFGDPLGLLMVYVASAQEGTVRIIMQGDRIDTLERSSERGAVGKATS